MRDATATRYGFLGVGAIAEAIVTGLCDDSTDAPTILLSPRNAARAAELAARYASVAIASDNQTLVDRVSVLVVCVRPQDAPRVLDELRFDADQAIVSVMAGVSSSRIAELVAPATNLARAIPLPAVERRGGVTPIHPPSDAARRLFDALGGSLPVTDASSFEALSAATATIAAHFKYLDTISQWLSAHGIPAHDASRYVWSMFAGLGTTVRDAPGDFRQLARDHATPGGINEQFSAMLSRAGAYELVDDSLQSILEGLRTETRSSGPAMPSMSVKANAADCASGSTPANRDS